MMLLTVFFRYILFPPIETVATAIKNNHCSHFCGSIDNAHSLQISRTLEEAHCVLKRIILTTFWHYGHFRCRWVISSLFRQSRKKCIQNWKIAQQQQTYKVEKPVLIDILPGTKTRAIFPLSVKSWFLGTRSKISLRLPWR